MFARLSESQPVTMNSFAGGSSSHSLASPLTGVTLSGLLPSANLMSLRSTTSTLRNAANTLRKLRKRAKYREGYKVTIKEELLGTVFINRHEYRGPLYILDVLDNGRGYITLAIDQVTKELKYGPIIQDALIDTAELVSDKHELRPRSESIMELTAESKSWKELLERFMQRERSDAQQVRTQHPESLMVTISLTDTLKRVMNNNGISSVLETPPDVSVPWANIEYEVGAKVGRITIPLRVPVKVYTGFGQGHDCTMNFPANSQVVFLKLPAGFNKRLQLMLDDAENLYTLSSCAGLQAAPGAQGGRKTRHRRKRQSKSRSSKRSLK